MTSDLGCFLEKIRHNSFEAEKCMHSGKYEDSIKYMKIILKDDSGFVFPQLKIKECSEEKFEAFGEMNYYLMNMNGNDIKAVFRKQKYGLYHYMAKLISLPFDCSAPSLFEEAHHSLQYSALPKNMEFINYYNINEKNRVKMEQCAYYWRMMIFPENKEKKDKMILPDNFGKILKKNHEEIIRMEKAIIY